MAEGAVATSYNPNRSVAASKSKRLIGGFAAVS